MPCRRSVVHVAHRRTMPAVPTIEGDPRSPIQRGRETCAERRTGNPQVVVSKEVRSAAVPGSCRVFGRRARHHLLRGIFVDSHPRSIYNRAKVARSVRGPRPGVVDGIYAGVWGCFSGIVRSARAGCMHVRHCLRRRPYLRKRLHPTTGLLCIGGDVRRIRRQVNHGSREPRAANRVDHFRDAHDHPGRNDVHLLPAI